MDLKKLAIFKNPPWPSVIYLSDKMINENAVAICFFASRFGKYVCVSGKEKVADKKHLRFFLRRVPSFQSSKHF